jgi:hypothetical protein
MVYLFGSEAREESQLKYENDISIRENDQRAEACGISYAGDLKFVQLALFSNPDGGYRTASHPVFSIIHWYL